MQTTKTQPGKHHEWGAFYVTQRNGWKSSTELPQSQETKQKNKK